MMSAVVRPFSRGSVVCCRCSGLRSWLWLIVNVVDVNHVDEGDVVIAEVIPVFFHHVVKMCFSLLCLCLM